MARKSKYQTQSGSVNAKEEWLVGLYIRLSREDGDKLESESVASQKAILQSFVSERPELGVYDCYIDDGWSGTDFNRPAFQKMLKDAAAKKINCVIVKDLSRFGRNYVEAGKYLETVFPLFNIRFISVNDQIDSTENPASLNSVIVPFKNIINDEYCRDISMKVRSALDIRRRQGKFIGSFAPYGYKKDENERGKLVIDEDAAQTVRFIYKKFLEGVSISGVARELNARAIPNPTEYKRQKGLKCNRRTAGVLWADSTVRRILTSEVYIGNLVQKKNEVISYKIHKIKAVDGKNRIVVQNSHRAIISHGDFEKVRLLLSRDTRISPKTQRLSVFAGFVKCGDCGRAMQKRTVKQPNKTYEYYICSTYKKLDKTACTKHAIRVEALEEAVLAFLNKYTALAVDFGRMLEKINRARAKSPASKRLAGELTAKENELASAQKILLDLYPDYKNGLLSREQYFALKEKYERTAETAKTAIGRIKLEIRDFDRGVDGSNEFISTFKKFSGFKKLTREIVVELIENIYIFENGVVEIRLKCRDSLLTASEYIENYTEKPAL